MTVNSFLAVISAVFLFGGAAMAGDDTVSTGNDNTVVGYHAGANIKFGKINFMIGPGYMYLDLDAGEKGSFPEDTYWKVCLLRGDYTTGGLDTSGNREFTAGLNGVALAAIRYDPAKHDRPDDACLDTDMYWHSKDTEIAP